MTLEGTDAPTLTRHVLKHVEADFILNTRVTRLDDFLNTFFPECDSFSDLSLLNTTLQIMGAYDASVGRWNPSAHPQGSELPYDVDFSNDANAIGQAACSPVRDTSPERPKTHVGADGYDQGFVPVPVSPDTYTSSQEQEVLCCGRPSMIS
ncbi:uncharacterized protein ARMOST_11071 [Armillaria ostoyae]|uniref:Uncharacterized protein n=1 Tax=Armillaria ostoyae TaxID=47428 RepID=A0A284RG40_ARMOS|nr:uncharacterized protein ARMOST_11071 [Armillaria ostoyae]